MEEEVMTYDGTYSELEPPPLADTKKSSSVIARLFENEQAIASHKRELEDHLEKINALANILGAHL